MKGAVTISALLLSLLSAAAGYLIVGPAPSQALALLAIVMSEKSVLVIFGAVVAALLALAGLFGGHRGLALVTLLLSLAALAAGLLPIVQARRLADATGVDLDVGRYLASRIDTDGPGKPQMTVPYATVQDGGAPRTLTLDVYLPRPRPATPGRAVLVVHGGFWSAGQKGSAALFSQWLADRGLTVFDVEYRLAPQPNWKTATGDVKCAIGWVRQHASTADWNVNPARLTVLGRSAGAHLALVAAYTPGDPALPPSCEAPDTSVDAVVAFYAPTDLAWGHAHPANLWAADSPAKIRSFVGGSPRSAGDLYRALSPALRVSNLSPRTLLVQGGRDQFVPARHMDLLAEKLRAAGIPHHTLFLPWAQHSFDYVNGGLGGQITEDVMLRFLGDAGPQK